jgi:H+/Cl- antiporter ClcA
MGLVSKSDLYIISFIVTGLWDVVLRIMTENWEQLPTIVKRVLPFIEYLKPYFEKHTLLAAALIAAFVGATTQALILEIMPFPQTFGSIANTQKFTLFMLLSFVVSALYGFIMKYSKLFPILEETYYKRLEKDHSVLRSMLHDGISGLIVQFTIVVLLSVKKIFM